MKINGWAKMSLALLAVGSLLLTDVLPASAAAPGRIPWMGGSLWASGANYAWKNFGYDFSDSSWTSNWSSIQADINEMQSKGVKTVRWWVFAHLGYAPTFSGSGRGSTVTGLPTNWVQHMVDATNYANSKGIKVYWCFTSFDLALNYAPATHDDIIDNSTVQQSFLNNAVAPIIDALKSNPGVMGWDIINEPEWIISSADGGDPRSDARRVFSLAQMRSFVQNSVNLIHNHGAQQPVSVGSASAKWSGKQYKFWTGLGLDFYDFHWYDWYTPYFDPSTTDASTLGLDKPIIIGEVMSDPSTQYSGATYPKNHQTLATGVYTHGFAGYMPWAWTDTNNLCRYTISPYLSNFESAYPASTTVYGGAGNTVLYDFEGSTQGWTGVNLPANSGPWSVNEWAFTKSNSLKANVNFGGGTYYLNYSAASTNLSGKTKLYATVKHATWGTPGSGIQAKLYVKTGSAYTWYDGGIVNIDSYSPTTLSLNLSSVSNLTDVREIGVQFLTPTNSSGGSAVYVDCVSVQ